MKKTYMPPEMINVLVDANDILTLSVGNEGDADVIDYSNLTQKQ